MDATANRDDLFDEGTMQIKDAVAWSGIGRSRLYEAMSKGDLPFVKVGERRLIPKRGLKAYLAGRLEGGTR